MQQKLRLSCTLGCHTLTRTGPNQLYVQSRLWGPKDMKVMAVKGTHHMVVNPDMVALQNPQALFQDSNEDC